MSASFRSSSNGDASGSATSLTINKPTGVAAGDVLLAFIHLNHSVAVIINSVPTGWSQVGSAQTVTGNELAYCYIKVAGASEPASYTWGTNSGTAPNDLAGSILAYSNAAQSSPIDVQASQHNASSTSAVAPSVTTATDDDVVVAAFFSDGQVTATPPTGMTERVDFFTSWSTFMSLEVADVAAPTAGATGTKTATLSAAKQTVGWTVTLKPGVPAQATLTAPVNASYQELASGFTFTWTHNSVVGAAQTAYSFRRKISGAGSYEYWNAGTGAWQSTQVWNAASAGSLTFGSGKWTDGNVYNWSVATQDSGGQGPFAADFTVTASAPPTASLTAPTGTITSSVATVTWTETLQSGAAQTNYRVVVESGSYGTSPGSGITFYDSGVVTGAALTQGVSGLINGTSYRFFVQVTETGGQTSPWASSTATVTLTPATTPTLTATADAANARTALTITNNDSHTVTAVIQASDDSGATWTDVRGADALALAASGGAATVYDYEATPARARSYRAQVAYIAAPNVITSAFATAGPITLALTSWWLKDPTNPAVNTSICDAQQHVRTSAGDSTAIYPAGRRLPLVLKGVVHGATGVFRTVTDTEAGRSALLAIYAATDTLLLQDPRGRQWYIDWTGDLTETQLQTDHPIYAISRAWVEVDVPG